MTSGSVRCLVHYIGIYSSKLVPRLYLTSPVPYLSPLLSRRLELCACCMYGYQLCRVEGDIFIIFLSFDASCSGRNGEGVLHQPGNDGGDTAISPLAARFGHLRSVDTVAAAYISLTCALSQRRSLAGHLAETRHSSPPKVKVRRVRLFHT